jgi:hypothetical protein
MNQDQSCTPIIDEVASQHPCLTDWSREQILITARRLELKKTYFVEMYEKTAEKLDAWRECCRQMARVVKENQFSDDDGKMAELLSEFERLQTLNTTLDRDTELCSLSNAEVSHT